MSGGEGINQVGGVTTQSTAPQSFDEGIERAGNPQRLNRSSIESVPGAKRKVPSSLGKSKEYPPLASRKISRIPHGEFRPLLSSSKKQVNLQDLAGIHRQNKTLTQIFERQESKTAQNKIQAELQVKELESGLKWAKSSYKKAVKLADSATLKLAVADKTGVPAQLRTTEKTALQELEQARGLVEKFKGKLAGAKADKAEFKTVEKLKNGFASRLEKLEKKVSQAKAAVDTRFTPLSVSDHKSRVSTLEKKLAAVESALKDLNQLGKDVAAAEEAHPGATPKDYGKKGKKLSDTAETVRAKGSGVLQMAKAKRDRVVQQQVAAKRATKEAARDRREMNEAYKKTKKADRYQDRMIQKKQEEPGKRTGRTGYSEIQTKAKTQAQPKPRNSTLKGRKGRKGSASLNDAKARPQKQSGAGTRLSGKSSWTTEDIALDNRLRRLKGQVAHDPITSSGNAKNFDQLRNQLYEIHSIDDLKTVVADRRSSKITPDQQRKYLGLLSAAVHGMAKNPQFADKMNDTLIRDVLKEQPEEARSAIKQMHRTKDDILQRRLNRLRDR